MYDAGCMMQLARRSLWHTSEMKSVVAVNHVGVQASICNMVPSLYGYAKIVSDDVSKWLYTGKLCLIGNEDP